jgi:hypothetical protein
MNELLVSPFEAWTKLCDSLRVIENDWGLTLAKHFAFTVVAEKLISADARVWGRVKSTVCLEIRFPRSGFSDLSNT